MGYGPAWSDKLKEGNKMPIIKQDKNETVEEYVDKFGLAWFEKKKEKLLSKNKIGFVDRIFDPHEINIGPEKTSLRFIFTFVKNGL